MDGFKVAGKVLQDTHIIRLGKPSTYLDRSFTRKQRRRTTAWCTDDLYPVQSKRVVQVVVKESDETTILYFRCAYLNDAGNHTSEGKFWYGKCREMLSTDAKKSVVIWDEQPECGVSKNKIDVTEFMQYALIEANYNYSVSVRKTWNLLVDVGDEKQLLLNETIPNRHFEGKNLQETYFLGRYVVKEFEGFCYLGVVVGYSRRKLYPSKTWSIEFMVVYMDNDSEEVEYDMCETMRGTYIAMFNDDDRLYLCNENPRRNDVESKRCALLIKTKTVLYDEA